MRNSGVQQLAPETFLALVGHPADVQAFETSKKELMEYLRKELRNDFLTLQVQIDPNRDVIKQTPPQQILKECVEKNPALGELLKALDAELA